MPLPLVPPKSGPQCVSDHTASTKNFKGGGQSHLREADDKQVRGVFFWFRCACDDLDPDEWELPPKPKWMRWHTYDKHVEKFDCYEGQLDALCLRTLQRILNQS